GVEGPPGPRGAAGLARTSRRVARRKPAARLPPLIVPAQRPSPQGEGLSGALEGEREGREYHFAVHRAVAAESATSGDKIEIDVVASIVKGESPSAEMPT